MKTVTIPAAFRPHYLAQVLASLRRNDCSGYELFVAVEPTPQVDETLRLLEAVDWMPVQVVRNPVLLGVRSNPYQLMQRAFEAGSILNVFLEEDVVIAPDAVRMANWYVETQGDQEWLCLNFLNYRSMGSNRDPLALFSSSGFNGLGLCIMRRAWEDWFSQEWFNEERVARIYPGRYGWDWSLGAVVAELKLRTLTPLLSRANHIGREGGVHCSPEYHDRTFGNLAVNADACPGAYKILAQDPPSLVPDPSTQLSSRDAPTYAKGQERNRVSRRSRPKPLQEGL